MHRFSWQELDVFMYWLVHHSICLYFLYNVIYVCYLHLLVYHVNNFIVLLGVNKEIIIIIFYTMLQLTKLLLLCHTSIKSSSGSIHSVIFGEGQIISSAESTVQT